MKDHGAPLMIWATKPCSVCLEQVEGTDRDALLLCNEKRVAAYARWTEGQ